MVGVQIKSRRDCDLFGGGSIPSRPTKEEMKSVRNKVCRPISWDLCVNRYSYTDEFIWSIIVEDVNNIVMSNTPRELVRSARFQIPFWVEL